MLILDTAIVIAMVCASWYGAATLPRGARVPVHFGLGASNRWMPRRVGLAVWPAVGIAAYLVLVVLERSGRTGGASLGLTILLVLALATQLGALRVARSRGGRR